MANEILEHVQAITDAKSALDSKRQELLDSFAQKNTQLADKDTQISTLQSESVVKDTTISTLQTEAIAKDASISTLKSEAAIKDARILELESQVGTGIDPAAVTAATTQVQELTAGIASIPTT